MTEQEILKRYGKADWQVVSRVPVTEKSTEHYDAATGQSSDLQSDPTRQVEKPTDRVRWVLAGPNGEPDELVVKGDRVNPDDPLPSNFTVVEPPKTAPQRTPTNTNPAKGQTRVVDRGGTWVQEVVVDDKGTWSVDTSVKPVPINPPSGSGRPPEPNVSTTAKKIPV